MKKHQMSTLWMICAFLIWLLVCGGLTLYALLGNRYLEHTIQPFWMQ